MNILMYIKVHNDKLSYLIYDLHICFECHDKIWKLET